MEPLDPDISGLENGACINGYDYEKKSFKRALYRYVKNKSYILKTGDSPRKNT